MGCATVGIESGLVETTAAGECGDLDSPPALTTPMERDALAAHDAHAWQT